MISSLLNARYGCDQFFIGFAEANRRVGAKLVERAPHVFVASCRNDASHAQTLAICTASLPVNPVAPGSGRFRQRPASHCA